MCPVSPNAKERPWRGGGLIHCGDIMNYIIITIQVWEREIKKRKGVGGGVL